MDWNWINTKLALLSEKNHIFDVKKAYIKVDNMFYNNMLYILYIFLGGVYNIWYLIKMYELKKCSDIQNKSLINL